MRERVNQRLERLAKRLRKDRLEHLHGYARDPAKRAAYELLNGAQD